MSWAAALLALRPKIILAAGSKEIPLRIQKSIRSSYFAAYVAHVCVPLRKLYYLALAHTFTFAPLHPAIISSCFTHGCQGGDYLSFAHTFMFSGVGSLWPARSRFISVFRCNLHDLRDLDRVFWVGPVRSSSYAHVFFGGICMIETFRTCLAGWVLHDLHDLRDLYDLWDLDYISLMESAWSRYYTHVWLDGICMI